MRYLSCLGLVITAGLLPWLGPAGPLRHDDLVDLEDSSGGSDGVLEAPALEHKQVQDTLLLGVTHTIALGIDVVTGVLVALLEITNELRIN